MRELRRLSLIAVLLLTCVGCDQGSKHVIRAHTEVGFSQSFFGDALRISHVENPGAFLSLGAELSPFARVLAFQFGVASLVLTLLAYASLARGLTAWQVTGLTLLAASGLGNLLDRLLRDGRVTDFINVGLGQLRTGIFNVADVIGVLGACILLIKAHETSAEEGRRNAT